MFSLFIQQTFLQSLLHARHYSGQWRVAEVSGVLETPIWASEAWFPDGNRAKETQARTQSTMCSVDRQETQAPRSLFSTL